MGENGKVGTGQGGTVVQCYSTGAVSGENGVGGLVGRNGGPLTDCCSSGAVSASFAVGGLVGENGGMGRAYENSTYVIRCHSSGKVDGNFDVGGLVGRDTVRYRNEGNFPVWSHGYVVLHSFWDTQTSGQSASEGGTGLTTRQMQAMATYTSAGWDFLGERANGLHEIWQMPDGGGYPVLAILHGYAPPQLQGLGTLQVPYRVSSAEELAALSRHEGSAFYRLTASIDLSGICWNTPVIDRFTGTFDGNGMAISNLTIKGVGRVGLFGVLVAGEVKDLRMVDVNIAATGGEAGALAGTSTGRVTRCFVSGTVKGAYRVSGVAGCIYAGEISGCCNTAVVSGKQEVGGLVGYSCSSVTQCRNSGSISGREKVGGLVGNNGYRGSVTNAYSTGPVTGTGYCTGGLVGENGGTVTHCYSTGAVSGKELVGGLVGENGGNVTQCYSTGTVSGDWHVGGLVGGVQAGSVGGSFWDTQTSGQAWSWRGTGKTTAEMQTASTFLDAGWDFVGETANGTEDIWLILEGKDYPHLWWEAPPE